MTTAAFPHACGDPLLVKEEPFDSPWDDAINDVFARLPPVLTRIVDTEAREVRMMAELVDVLRRLTIAARITPNRGIHDENRDIRVRQIEAGEVATREVDDANAVGLADRP